MMSHTSLKQIPAKAQSFKDRYILYVNTVALWFTHIRVIADIHTYVNTAAHSLSLGSAVHSDYACDLGHRNIPCSPLITAMSSLA